MVDLRPGPCPTCGLHQQRIDVAEENARSAVGAMRLAMEAQKKAEALAQERLDGLLAAASFSVLLMKEIQRLQDKPPTLAPLDDRLRIVDLRSVIQNVITRCHDRGEGFDIMALEAACAVRDALRADAT